MMNIMQVKFVKKYIKRWRSRFILNKQAVLLLFLFSLFLMSSRVLGTYTEDNLQSFKLSYIRYTNLFFVLSGFLSAWLVGWKYRLVDIVFIGMIITGVACLVGVIPGMLVSASIDCGRVCTTVLTNVFWIFLNTGLAPVIANMFQLVIEQIPGASSSQLSSLVSWFIFSKNLGYWLSNIIIGILQHCVGPDARSYLKYLPYFILVSGAILSAVMSIYALLKHKLIDNSPTSNTVSHIYQVVKYAIKHKRPVQRSSMTYWEEEIPRGMDLGKRKYGGPFTSEQVEDVKTFFRLLLFFLPGIFYSFADNLSDTTLDYVKKAETTNNTSISLVQEVGNFCTMTIMYCTFDINFWMLLSVLVYEFIVMPILEYRLPNIRWKLKFAIFLDFLLSLIITIIAGINFYLAVTYVIKQFWIGIGLNILIGITDTIFLVSVLEFILAQTPYAMRNFFINIYLCSSYVVSPFSEYILYIYNSQCNSTNCPIIYSLVSLSVYFVAMLLFLIAITRYRLRSRGQEDEHQQRWIEEVYDRYLEHVDN